VVLAVRVAQQVLLAQQALLVRRGLSGHIYKVKLMLHILTLEQEMEQHHD
jgi:hypothetical protein